ncbi:hypothetical protein ACWGR4_12285 [Embleya sp. NPDC055664]
MPTIASSSKPPWRPPAPAAPGGKTVTTPQSLETAATRMDAASKRIVDARNSLQKETAGTNPFGNDPYSAKLKPQYETVVTTHQRGTANAPALITKTGTGLRNNTRRTTATDTTQADNLRKTPTGPTSGTKNPSGGQGKPPQSSGGSGPGKSGTANPGSRPSSTPATQTGGSGSGSGGNRRPPPPPPPPPGTPPPYRPEDIQYTEASRRHILESEGGKNGGHRYGTGIPTKTEFPQRWTDPDVERHVLDLVRNSSPTTGPKWTNDPAGNRVLAWEYIGTRDNVTMSVTVMENGEIRTAYPLSGEGVHRNPSSPNPRPSWAPPSSTPRWDREHETWHYTGIKKGQQVDSYANQAGEQTDAFGNPWSP